MKNLFLDMEFTGLVQNTTLISIGLIDEDGRSFYGEMTDYDKSMVDEWLESNVISQLILGGEEAWGGGDYYLESRDDGESTLFRGPMVDLKEVLLDWLNHYDEDEKVRVVSDCYAWDWVLFCEIFGGGLSLPSVVHYIPLDLATMFERSGIDPDVNRESFVGNADPRKHNALHDAKIIKECYEHLECRDGNV